MKALSALVLGILLALAALFALGDSRPLVQVQRTPPVVEPAGDAAPRAIAGAQLPAAPAPATAPAVTRTADAARPGTLPAAGVGADTMVAGRQAPAPALLLPVQGVGVGQLQDTFNDARSQGRSHDAIDIMAPAGTPVLAVADGMVEKLFDSRQGGLTVYQFEPGGRFAYYYAHLQRYADGIAEGQPLRRGQVIGYVGSTGNASPEAPHLHFAIFVLGPERRWWEGNAVNPYPILRGTAPLPP